MVDDVQITALKQRRAIFQAHGQTEKVKAVDVEIARLRGALPPDPARSGKSASEPDPEPVPDPIPAAETADADLTGVEVAAPPRRGRGRPRRG